MHIGRPNLVKDVENSRDTHSSHGLTFRICSVMWCRHYFKLAAVCVPPDFQSTVGIFKDLRALAQLDSPMAQSIEEYVVWLKA